MKKIVVFCTLVFFVLSMKVGAQECSVLRVAGGAGWLPVTYVDEKTKEPLGISYDFARVIGTRLNLTVEIDTTLPWKRMLYYLEVGAIDMTPAIYKTTERAAKYSYTKPYFKNEQRVFVQKGKEFSFQKFEDLIGLSGGFSSGASFGEEFDVFAKKHNLRLEGVSTKKQRIKKLLDGRNDYFINDYLDVMTYLKLNGLQGKIVALPHPISTTYVHFALSPKSPCAKLVPQINALIDETIEDGTFQAIVDKYIK